MASLLVQQIYTAIVDTSRNSGGELSNRMNFILDEFSNFTKIESFQSMLTVSRSRNCRFVLAVQSIFGQLEEKYGKEGTQNILDNTVLIYLKSSNIDTANKISEKLGTYSAQSYSESSNSNIKSDKSSSSMSIISRKLLTADEVLKIESPYILVMIAGQQPALLNVPDISKMHFNQLNGMGSKEHNKKLRIDREKARPIRKMEKIKIWNIWDQVKEQDYEELEEAEEELRILRENWRVNKKGKELIESQETDNKKDN